MGRTTRRSQHAPVGSNGIRLEQPVEKGTGIQKVMTVTMDATGTGVTVKHELINRNQKPYELAVWALTIMNPGGTAIVPQEPYKKHADALLPARPLVLWHYTDLSDSRFAIGPKYIRLSTNEKMPEPQKFGVLNKTGWAAYAKNGLLFVKRMKYEEGATYPDYNSSVEVFTQGGFIEVESLGPLRTLKPGETAEHTETLVAAQGREGGQDGSGSRSRDRQADCDGATRRGQAEIRRGSPSEKS